MSICGLEIKGVPWNSKLEKSASTDTVFTWSERTDTFSSLATINYELDNSGKFIKKSTEDK
jgi:hypothetical protein